MNTQLTLAILAALLGNAAQAADFRVTRTDDPVPNGCFFNDCSVREAVIAANAAAGADRVVLRSGTFELTRIDTSADTHQDDLGPLWVKSSIVFIGAGEAATRLRWNPGLFVKYDNPIVYLSEPASNPVNVSVDSMTLSHGHGAQGGCVYFYGAGSSLTLSRATVESCSAANTGGAIHLLYSALNLDSATLRQNSTANHGGALQIAGPVNVTSRNTRITGNTADVNAGAVYVWGNGLIGWNTTVNWVDNGGTVIENNVAGGAGGAFQVKDTASLFLSTAANVAPASWLVLRDNVAGSIGGAVHNAPPLGNAHQSRFERVRFLNNEAADGGAIATQSALNVVDAEFASNKAKTGAGGAIAFMGSVDLPSGRSLRRVSFRDNQAATGGGAVASACASFSAQDVSMHLNHAAGSGRGQAIETDGSATLRHVTLYGNTSSPLGAPGLSKRYTTACPSTQLRFANSLIVDYCSGPNGGLVSDGGNQLGPQASACPALASVDARQGDLNNFLLSFGSFGGAFEFVGWVADSAPRPQRNFGLASQCSDTDIRGLARTDGLCDSGAYEQTGN